MSNRNFIRPNLEQKGYFAENKTYDEFRFWYRPLPPKMAEVELAKMESLADPALIYDNLVERFLRQVVKWDCGDVPLNAESVTMLHRVILWRANRVILGNESSDKDPTEHDEAKAMTGAEIVGKSDGRTTSA